MKQTAPTISASPVPAMLTSTHMSQKRKRSVKGIVLGIGVGSGRA